jgi:hypothetical protein
MTALASMVVFPGCSRNFIKPVPSNVTPASPVVAEAIESQSSTQQGTANVATRDVTGMGLTYQSTLPLGMVFLLFSDKLMSHLREQRRLANASRRGQEDVPKQRS